MTKEELRQHCEKQVEECEKWAKYKGIEPSGKVYEEHKLILDLINALEQQPSEDCVSRQAVLDILSHYAHNFGADPEIKALPPVTPTHGTCKDCKYLLRDNPDCFCCRITYRRMTNENFYCGNYEKREGEVVEMTREIWEERKNPPIDGKTDF